MPKIVNETPESWVHDAEGAFYQFPRSCQIAGLSQILEGYFGRDTDRVVLEIGAYDGFTFSNTWGLLYQGWRGILVEPTPDHCDLTRRNTARFQNSEVHCFALGEKSGKVNFYRLGPYTSESHSQVTSVFNSIWYKDLSSIEETTVDMVATEDFVSQYLNGVPDLLVIDVEGYELPIISTLLRKGINPQMIIIELNGMAQEDADSKIHFLLVSSGYIRMWCDAINAIYLRAIDTLDGNDSLGKSIVIVDS